jgi:sugar phosphate isomerase/epimerase
MRIGIMGGCLARHKRLGLIAEPHDYIRKAHQYGYDTYQLLVGRELPSLDEEDVRAVKRLLDGLGMTASLACDLIHKADDTAFVRHAFDMARLLGAHAILGHWRLGLYARLKASWDGRAARRQLAADIEATKRLAGYAEAYAIPIGFENHIDYVIDEIEQIVRTVDSPYVGLNFDTGNPLVYAEDPTDYVRRLADRVFALHLKDGYAVPDPDGAQLIWCNTGEGLVDLREIVGILGTQGREIPYNLEFWALSRTPVPFRTDAFWRNLGRDQDDNDPIVLAIGRDAARGHPVPGDTDQEGVEEEKRVLAATPAYLKSLAAAGDDGCRAPTGPGTAS